MWWLQGDENSRSDGNVCECGGCSGVGMLESRDVVCGIVYLGVVFVISIYDPLLLVTINYYCSQIQLIACYCVTLCTVYFISYF